MELGKVIAEQRKIKNMTQAEFAEKIGISQNALSQIETGNNNPSEETMKNISKILEIPPAILYWKTLSEKDIPKSKREAFKQIKPSMDSLIDALLGENTLSS